jgi:hypothetical protein
MTQPFVRTWAEHAFGEEFLPAIVKWIGDNVDPVDVFVKDKLYAGCDACGHMMDTRCKASITGHDLNKTLVQEWCDQNGYILAEKGGVPVGEQP